MWKIKKIVSKGDYNYALVPEHPFCTKNGYVLEHRIVVENNLGRLLNRNEVVHHKNEDKKDNRYENLEVLTSSEHATKHGLEQGKAMVEFKCPNCLLIFVRERHRTKLFKKDPKYKIFCSRQCNGHFSRKTQLHGLTTEMELAISGNIVREFHSTDNPEQTAKQPDA